MRAILMEKHGGPEVLRLGDALKPRPSRGQVLIKVHATSVNGADLVQRRGLYPPPPGESNLLGLEAAGRIEEIGAGVRGYETGERVMSLVAGGGYAEYATAYARHLIRIPAALDFAEAACICETYITAYLNLFMLGRLRNGDSALVHGGGGGVNTAALHLCKVLAPECKVFVTASSAKITRVEELGAFLAIDYRREDFAEIVRKATAKRGVDVILDHVGGTYLSSNLDALAVGGRLVIIGLIGGAKAEINLGRLLVKRQQIIGSVLRSLSIQQKARIVARFTRVVMPLFERGVIAPAIHEVLPLQSAAEAHRVMESGRHFGKIVLTL